MGDLWARLTDTQTKDVTSSDLMNLGQRTFIDAGAKASLSQLEDLTNKLRFLTANGAPILADSITVKSYTIDNSSQEVKPSNIFDATSDPFASGYLCKVIGVSATFSDAGAALTGKLKNTVAIMRGVSSVAASQEPLLLYNPDGTYFNENNPLVFAESGNVSTTIEIAVAIVSRGGA